MRRQHDIGEGVLFSSTGIDNISTGIRKIISLDSDFDIYRLPGKERILNIYKA